MVQQNEVTVCKYKKDFGQVNLKVTSGKLVVVFDIDDTIWSTIGIPSYFQTQLY